MEQIKCDLSKVVQSIDGIRKCIAKSNGVKAELIYKAKDLDRVLFSGKLNESVSAESISGDTDINGVLAEYLEKEGFVIMCSSKEGVAFILTRKGYTFKAYGGFIALEKEEERKRKQEQKRQDLWVIAGWAAAAITPFLRDIVQFLLNRF